jgi:hypothetical protein
MDQSTAGGRRDAGDQRLPDHEFQFDAGRLAGIDPSVFQSRQFRQPWWFGWFGWFEWLVCTVRRW